MLTEHKIKVFEHRNKYPIRESFMVDDVIDIVKDINEDTTIVRLSCTMANANEIMGAIHRLKDIKNCLICMNIYVSEKEYPADKYYLNPSDEGPGKELLPLAEVLERDYKIARECGFININSYVYYQYQIPCIYMNEIGCQVMYKMNSRMFQHRTSWKDAFENMIHV